jgi:hypothetical protein
MGLKRLGKKTILGGGSFIAGHIQDALKKKEITGKSFRECLEDSIKETFTEDLPGTSHVYNIGKKDGKIVGTIEQAARDVKKAKEIEKKHKEKVTKLKRINQAYKDLLNEVKDKKKD